MLLNDSKKFKMNQVQRILLNINSKINKLIKNSFDHKYYVSNCVLKSYLDIKLLRFSGIQLDF